MGTGYRPAKASGRWLYDDWLRDAVSTSAAISQPSSVPLRTRAIASANSRDLADGEAGTSRPWMGSCPTVRPMVRRRDLL